MHSEPQGNRIPTSITTDQKLFGRYTVTDVAIAAFPGVLVALTVQLLVPPSTRIGGVAVQVLVLPLAAVAMGGGATFVYLTPQHTTSIDWFTRFLSFATSPSRHQHDAARDLTHVRRLYPEHDVVERTDGALVGVVKVHPPTMALATSAEWSRKASAFTEFLNTTVEFPIQLYSTTRAFDVEDHVAHYERRLTDEDVVANQTVASLIRGYVNWHRTDRHARTTTIRDHYIVVPVMPSEVQFDESSHIDQLATLPVVGLIARLLFAPPRAVEREALLDKLEERLHRVTTGLREIDDCDAHQVSVEQTTELLAEYWTGTAPEYGDIDQVLDRSPLLCTEREST